MDRVLMKSEIKAEEGEKLQSYLDSLGYWTIGIGILIDPRKGGDPAPFGLELRFGATITQAQSDILFNKHLDEKLAQLDARLPWWRKLDDVRQRVLVNMAFQMGINGLLGFENTLDMVESGDYQGAADGMLHSKWAAQTPARAKRLSDRMRTGIA